MLFKLPRTYIKTFILTGDTMAKRKPRKSTRRRSTPKVPDAAYANMAAASLGAEAGMAATPQRYAWDNIDIRELRKLGELGKIVTITIDNRTKVLQ